MGIWNSNPIHSHIGSEGMKHSNSQKRIKTNKLSTEAKINEYRLSFIDSKVVMNNEYHEYL